MSRSGRIVVYGMSDTGYAVAAYLAETGVEVTAAVPSDSKYAAALGIRGVAVVSCNPSDFSTLRTLALERADAVVLPSDDELFNLSAALHAVEVNPDIRVVLRLFNVGLGKKLEKSVRNFVVLSVSQLASATFATAALIRDPVLAFERGGQILSIFREEGSAFHGLTVAEIESRHDVRVVSLNGSLFPEPGCTARQGDTLALFSTYRQAAAISGIRALPGDDAAPAPRERNPGGGLVGAIRQLDRVLLVTVLALVGLAGLCAAYFHFVDGLSPLDAVYFVVTVITTTGFGDITLKEAGALSKSIGIALMLTAVTLMAMVYAIISDTLLRKRLDIFLGRKRMRQRGHIILCGVGDVGVRVLEDLVRLGEPVVVVEKNAQAKFNAAVRRWNVPLVIADASLDETLLNANVREARSVICATDNDIRNLEIGLNARSLNPGIRLVIRILEKGFAEKVERRLGIPFALSSSDIAAPAFAAAARGDATIGAGWLDGSRLVIRAKSAGDRGDGKELSASKLLLLERPDGTLCLPQGADGTGDGDRLICACRL